MTWNPAVEQAKVASDLRAIVDMCTRLRDQAEHDALRGDVGNSDAMMALGVVGNTEAANNRLAAAEERHLELGTPEPTYVQDWTDDDDQPPLLVLATWEDMIRDERDEPTYMKASIEHAAGYIRDRLDWAFGSDEYGDANWLGVDALATDLRRLRSRLEAMLTEGYRTITGAPCLQCAEPLTRRAHDPKPCTCDLRVPHGPHRDGCCCLRCKREERHQKHDQGGAREGWQCRNTDCPVADVSDEDYARNVAGTAIRHATQLTATDMEKRFDVKAGTVRVWASRNEIRKHGKDASGRQLYNVADVARRADERLAA